MPAILLNNQQYCWIINNIASNIADFPVILLISNIADTIAGNIADNIFSNIADPTILLAILSAILLIIQQYWTRSH